MDLLDRLLGHDTWTTRELLRLCAGLTEEQLDREFCIGLRTVRATMAHMIRNIEAWTALMSGGEVRRDDRNSVPDLVERLDRSSADFAELARAVAARGGWDELWVDHMDDPPSEKTFGGAIAHVITHNMHHRAQVMHMMRKLGVHGVPEGDVLNWEHQTRVSRGMGR
ncbi:DinB family protein [Candidatus Poribacteria bacterium]|nr:DinB family protein [Candidatus Poribacteria bacterium]